MDANKPEGLREFTAWGTVDAGPRWRYRCVVVVGLLGLLCPWFAVAQSVDPCKVVLELAATNVQSSDLRSARDAFAYQELCKARRSTSSSAEKLVIGVVYEDIPIKVDGAGNRSKEDVYRWCSENTHLESTQGSAAFFESTVFQPAVAAWTQCRQFQAYSVHVVPVVSADAMVVDVAITNQTGDPSVRLLPVRVAGDPGARCTEGASGAEISEPIVLPPGRTVSVHCERELVDTPMPTGQTIRRMPAVTFSLFTDRSPQPIQMHLPVVEYPAATILSTEAATLDARLRALEEGDVVLVEVESAFVTTKPPASKKTVHSRVIVGPDICLLSATGAYGSKSRGCTIAGNPEAGWVLTAYGDEVTTNCRVTCWNVVLKNRSAP